MIWKHILFIEQPAYQALVFALFSPALLLIIKPKSADRAWTIAAYIFAMFLTINAIMLWFDDNPWHYFFYSLGTSVAYISIVAISMPALLKALRLQSSQESAMAFLIVIFQPFALLLIMFTKWIFI
ncbi:MAG: hypothetical protein V4580_10995 [Bacteroidota bacterium]